MSLRYWEPYWFNLIARPILSSAAGSVVGFGLWGIIAYFSPIDPMGWELALLLSMCVALLIGWNEQETVSVPEARVAILTFWGRRIRFYLIEGNYKWIGRRLLLDISKKVSYPDTAENGQGYVYTGEIPVQIWNEAGDENITMTNLAKDESTVSATLTIVIEVDEPKLWTSSFNAILDVAERARTAFRSGISFFIGSDITDIKNLLGRMMGGRAYVTIFLQKTDDVHAAGSILRNRAGVCQIEEIDLPEGVPLKYFEQQKKAAFIRKIEENADEFDPKVLKSIRDSKGKIIAEVLSISDTLDSVAAAVGARYVRASVGNIRLSPEVEGAANRAASEVYQRAAQMASALALKAARKAALPTPAELKNPALQDTMMIAAAQDNPGVTVTHVTGGANGLTGGLIAAATKLKDKK